MDRLARTCPGHDERIVIFNNDHYSGTNTFSSWALTCNTTTPEHARHLAAVIGPTKLHCTDQPCTLAISRPWSLVHELGHSFACLKDTYNNNRWGHQYGKGHPNIDGFGCSKWCSGTPTVPAPNNQDCAAQQTEADCLALDVKPPCRWNAATKTCSPQKLVDDKHQLLNVGRGCLPGTGCYQGAEGLQGYRALSYPNTIMGYAEQLEFDIPSLRHLKQLLLKYR